MIDKKYLYGGGALAVGGVFYFLKKRRDAVNAQLIAQSDSANFDLITNAPPSIAPYPISAIGGSGGGYGGAYDAPVSLGGSQDFSQLSAGGTSLSGQGGDQLQSNPSSIYDSLLKLVGLQGKNDLNLAQNSSVTYLAGLFGGASGNVDLKTDGSGSTKVTVYKDPTLADKRANQDAAFVNSLYQKLGRTADEGGAAYWLNKLSSTGNYDTVAANFATAARQNGEKTYALTGVMSNADSKTTVEANVTDEGGAPIRRST